MNAPIAPFPAAIVLAHENERYRRRVVQIKRRREWPQPTLPLRARALTTGVVPAAAD